MSSAKQIGVRSGSDEIDAVVVWQSIYEEPVIARMAFATAGLTWALSREAADQGMVKVFAVERPAFFDATHHEAQLCYIAFAMLDCTIEVFAKGARRSNRTVQFVEFRHSFALLVLAFGWASFFCVSKKAIDRRRRFDLSRIRVGDSVSSCPVRMRNCHIERNSVVQDNLV
jgi:hypothetical protein